MSDPFSQSFQDSYNNLLYNLSIITSVEHKSQSKVTDDPTTLKLAEQKYILLNKIKAFQETAKQYGIVLTQKQSQESNQPKVENSKKEENDNSAFKYPSEELHEDQSVQMSLHKIKSIIKHKEENGKMQSNTDSNHAMEEHKHDQPQYTEEIKEMPQSNEEKQIEEYQRIIKEQEESQKAMQIVNNESNATSESKITIANTDASPNKDAENSKSEVKTQENKPIEKIIKPAQPRRLYTEHEKQWAKNQFMERTTMELLNFIAIKNTVNLTKFNIIKPNRITRLLGSNAEQIQSIWNLIFPTSCKFTMQGIKQTIMPAMHSYLKGTKSPQSIADLKSIVQYSAIKYGYLLFTPSNTYSSLDYKNDHKSESNRNKAPVNQNYYEPPQKLKQQDDLHNDTSKAYHNCNEDNCNHSHNDNECDSSANQYRKPKKKNKAARKLQQSAIPGINSGEIFNQSSEPKRNIWICQCKDNLAVKASTSRVDILPNDKEGFNQILNSIYWKLAR